MGQAKERIATERARTDEAVVASCTPLLDITDGGRH